MTVKRSGQILLAASAIALLLLALSGNAGGTTAGEWTWRFLLFTAAAGACMWAWDARPGHGEEEDRDDDC